MLKNYLNISVRPGFQVPMQVLENAHRAKQEKEAKDAVRKMIDDKVWAKINAPKGKETFKHPGMEAPCVPADLHMDDQPLDDPASSATLETEELDTPHAVPVPAEDVKDLQTTDNASGEPSDPEKTMDLKTIGNVPGEPCVPESVPGEPCVPESVPEEPAETQDSAKKKEQAKKDRLGRAKAKAKNSDAKNGRSKVKKETKKSQTRKTEKCEAATSRSKTPTKKDQVDEEGIAKRIHCVPQLLIDFS